MKLSENGTKPSTSPIFEFGEYRMDMGRRLLLRRDGVPVPLTPRLFETLRFLVEHSDTVLDKERLMEAVWPDSIVEENNLTQSISKLRQVLGEKPGAHRFIVTVPGRGYRFVAEVKRADAPAAREAKSETRFEPDLPQTAAETIPPVPRDVKVAQAFSSPEGRLQAGSLRYQEAGAGRRNLRPVFFTAIALLLLGAAAFFLWRGRSVRLVAAPATISSAPVFVPEKSIAVLPFENLSSDAENAYFTAGVQDEILSDLAKVSELKVISRTSANLYQSGSPRNAHEIGQQLGVAHLLEGSVQRAGNRIRVNAQLVDVRTDAHLWAQSYDRDLADVFAIQAEIAQTIADQLRARISPNEKTRIETRPTDNPEAYLLYLQAAERWRIAASKQDAIAADQLYAQAIALDPGFALAQARASMLNSYMYQLGRDPQRKAKARALAEAALRLAPDLAEAHLASGVYWYRTENNYSAASQEFSIAGAASANDPEILELSGAILRHQGHWREALASSARAEELDPRHVHRSRAKTQMELRDWAAAAASYNQMLKVDPSLADGWMSLAYLEVYRNQNPAGGRAILEKLPDRIKTIYDVLEVRWDLALLDRDFAAAEKLAPDFPLEEFPLRQGKNFYTGLVALARGDTSSAHVLLEQVRTLNESAARDHPNDPKFHAALGQLYAWLGRKDDAVRESQRAVELCPESKDAVEGPRYLGDLALVYARTGEADRAIPLLERLLTTPAASGITLAELRLRWEWDPLRSDQRFQKILAAPEPKTIYK